MTLPNLEVELRNLFPIVRFEFAEAA